MKLPAQILERFRSTCEKRNVPLTLIHITSGPQIPIMHLESERYHIKSMRRVLADSRIDTLDLVDLLWEKRLELGPKFETPHGHWSPAGNRLIASEVARHIKRGRLTRGFGEECRRTTDSIRDRATDQGNGGDPGERGAP